MSPVCRRVQSLEGAMLTITVALPEERMVKLNELAERLGVAPEDLVRVSVEELLARPEPGFEQAVQHVLKKNAELYRRLA
jgi:hypothetical protein